MPFTKQEVWDNAFTSWWLKYLSKHYRGFRPELRVRSPYHEMEEAAIDAARWARKRTLRDARTGGGLLLR